MKKIQFTNGTTINGASTFNAMQDNVEDVFNGETPMGSILVEDIKCKNEFNINKVLESFYANYSIDGDNITITSAGAYANIRILVDVEMGKQYTLSAIGINTLDTPTNISIYKTNGSDRYIEQYGYGTTPNFNLTFTPTENQIIIMFYANPTPDANFNTVKYSNIQLEKGEASEYTPSKKFGYNDRESMGKIIVDDIECKNILPNNIQSQVRNGLTITRNDDGSITLNGTTTSGTYLDIYNNEQGIKLKGDYRFYLFGSSTLNNLQGTINGSNVIYIKFAETAESVVVNYSTETILTKIFTFIAKGSSFDNVTLKYMITKGTNEESYVPYKEFGNNKHIYSIDEHIVGTWIDGKTLYEKTIVFPNGTGTTEQVSYNLSNYGINDADEIFMVHPSYYTYAGIGTSYPFSFYDGNYYDIAISPTKMDVRLGFESIANSKFVVTLNYTKTAD